MLSYQNTRAVTLLFRPRWPREVDDASLTFGVPRYPMCHSLLGLASASAWPRCSRRLGLRLGFGVGSGRGDGSNFFTTGAVSVLQKQFLYYSGSLCTREAISLLQGQSLYYRINFFTTWAISLLRKQFLYSSLRSRSLLGRLRT